LNSHKKKQNSKIHFLQLVCFCFINYRGKIPWVLRTAGYGPKF
jgi:hypothetical protein